MAKYHDRTSWLKGGVARCLTPPGQPLGKPWRLVLLGAPGVGKGTQSELLGERLGACHLSTGDVFRASKSTPEGELSPALASALDHMSRGALVPDETVLEMVAERSRCLRCSGGFILDGFPRTVPQAKALEKLLKEQAVGLTAVLNYRLPIAQIVARLGARRVCSSCKAVYHLTGLPPKVEGVCDRCGGQLYQRDDDRPESIRVRMQAYRESTQPLIDFYRRRGLLISIEAKGAPEEIYERTRQLVLAKLPPGHDFPAVPAGGTDAAAVNSQGG
ncbi:MAG TPA: nucleoside monophosphate kinase [Opitutaceae bacterium]|nr:nucleoside monophosphate kinase [Opitutaceae bacterium]